jgi:hypothetical protein
MRWLIPIGFAFALSAVDAQAQTSVVCGHYENDWAKVRTGTNIAAMNRVIATIPDLCSDLKARAEEHRDAVETRPVLPAKAAPIAKPSAVARLRAARNDPDLKTGYEIFAWLCANISPDGFDLDKAYLKFPEDKLDIKAETRTPDKEQEHILVVREAAGPLYKVEYRYQISASDNHSYGFSIFITSIDTVTNAIFPSREAADKWMATYGEVKASITGPNVGFGPVNAMLNQSPLNLSVWDGGFPIYVGWFSPAGLKYVGEMCKKA